MTFRPLSPITPEREAIIASQVQAIRDRVLLECSRWAGYRSKGIAYDPETGRVAGVVVKIMRRR